MTSTSLTNYGLFTAAIMFGYLIRIIYYTYLFNSQCIDSVVKYGFLHFMGMCISTHFMLVISITLLIELIMRYNKYKYYIHNFKFVNNTVYFIVGMNIFINIIYALNYKSFTDASLYSDCQVGYQYYKSIADAIFINQIIIMINLFTVFTLLGYKYYKTGGAIEY